MKVTEHLERRQGPIITFEIIPPLRGGNVTDLMALMEDLMRYEPPFIDITSHAAQVVYEETNEGIQRRVKRKRPGTIGICALIQNKYKVDAVPHAVCLGFTREETEDFLIELNYLGIDNVLAVKGDDSGYRKPIKEGRSANETALDLVQQIDSLNQGRYLEEGLLDADPMNFGIGVSGYPEKHFAAPNLESDLRNTKAKIDAGAGYIVTQMFFNNEHYFRYVEQCRERGIDVPIIPGLKILTSKKQLRRLPEMFHCEIPVELADEVEAATKRSHVIEIGIEWAARQAEELLNNGAPSLHFYVMLSSKAVKGLMEKLKP
jgi:methylenetetrahydrofolate reductase (NADPH)